jgi:hypothetical protein
MRPPEQPATLAMNRFRLGLPATILFLLLTPGCAWVRLSEAGTAVRVVDTVTATTCTRVGRVTANTRDRVAGMARVEVKQEEELQTLARNEAATLGANAIVATSAIEDGRQRFDALVCPF